MVDMDVNYTGGSGIFPPEIDVPANKQYWSTDGTVIPDTISTTPSGVDVLAVLVGGVPVLSEYPDTDPNTDGTITDPQAQEDLINQDLTTSVTTLFPEVAQDPAFMSYLNSISDAIQQLREQLSQAGMQVIFNHLSAMLTLLAYQNRPPRQVVLRELKDELSDLKRNHAFERSGAGDVYPLWKYPKIMSLIKELGIPLPAGSIKGYDGKAKEAAEAGTPPYDDPDYAAMAKDLPSGWEAISLTNMNNLIASVDDAIQQEVDKSGSMQTGLFLEGSKDAITISYPVGGDPEKNLIFLYSQLVVISNQVGKDARFNIKDNPALAQFFNSAGIRAMPYGFLNGDVDIGQLMNTIKTAVTHQGSVWSFDKDLQDFLDQLEKDPLKAASFNLVYQTIENNTHYLQQMIEDQKKSVWDHTDSLGGGNIFRKQFELSQMVKTLTTMQETLISLENNLFTTFDPEYGLNYNVPGIVDHTAMTVDDFINEGRVDHLLNMVNVDDPDNPMTALQKAAASVVLTSFVLVFTILADLKFKGKEEDVQKILTALIDKRPDLAPYCSIAIMLFLTQSVQWNSANEVKKSIGVEEASKTQDAGLQALLTALAKKEDVQDEEIKQLQAMIQFLTALFHALMTGQTGPQLNEEMAKLANVLGQGNQNDIRSIPAA